MAEFRPLPLSVERGFLKIGVLLKSAESSNNIKKAQVELHNLILSVRADIYGTPVANWREEKQEDPHGTHYDGERAKLAGGQYTDDEVANMVYMNPGIANLTVAKERIRWLSRKLVKTTDELKKLQGFAQEHIKAN